MRLTVLGCAGTFPAPDSPCSSYLLESGGFRLLVDAGNGALGALQRHVGVLDVDAVFVSHLHGDHYLDLVPYVYVRRYHPAGRAPLLPVYGPPGTEDAIQSSAGDPVREVYGFVTVAEGRFEIGPFAVVTGRMNHPVECYAARFEADGRSLTYSGDTGETDALPRLAEGSDLLLCEASYLDGVDNLPGLHLTGSQAGHYAAAAGARRLLLTHLVPWGDRAASLAAAQAAYDGPVALACDAASVKV
jgi:ribonuclease BN (tRNA processing enzyme)